ncbi:MAG: redoxin domain-containing protein [Pyrinomonadaceae bacterium]|nr:redoxin domain-containing protein [Pyrinomonadaceae bacterium]
MLKKYFLFGVLLGIISWGNINLFAQSIDDMSFAKVRAPELVGGTSWLNTDKPLSLQALRGKVVLLDFWTYGCVNCIHIIPDLKKLEAKYPNNLVVIGVHSAKFDNEAKTENIRKIILRYEIEHPVVNDADFKIWNSYAVRAWPTRVLIDPKGYIIGQISGEGSYNEIDGAIAKSISESRKKGELNEKPLSLVLEKAKVGNLPLSFPGKVLADEKSNRLFISDSNHNRIVITDLQGKLLQTIGSGEASLKDGNFQTATFNRPQGLALDGENLFVADTENHAIRRVNLQTNQVETLSGDGKQADWRANGGDAKTSRLSTPWDLVKVGSALYIAMAGTHQIWKLDFITNTVAPYAGTGAEARRDGSIDEAAFAQPSGITTDGKKLWIADSESNIIRQIDLQKENVETLAGGDLFDFGDKDGFGDNVRLQHPLGVFAYNGNLLVADTYNHKIKQLDPERQTVKTFLGNGKSGQIDGDKPQFYEPGGLSIANGKLFVADTNNQAIRVVDLQTKQVSTLKIEGLTSPKQIEVTNFSPNLKELKIDAQEIGLGSAISLNLNLTLPNGYHLNKDAPNRFEVMADEKIIKIEKAKGKLDKLPFSIPIQTLQNGETKLQTKFSIYYCRDDNTGECMIKTLSWSIPIKISSSVKNEINLNSIIE